jgi:hypothetical protein
MIKIFFNKTFQYLNKKPYLIFFSTIYICLISKYYIENKINSIYKEEKLLKIYKDEIQKLNNEYEEEVYNYLKYSHSEQ